MKRHSMKKLLVAMGVCILLPLGNVGMADETADPPDKTKWVCKFCLVSNGWLGEWNLGLIYVNDPTPKFADYRGLIDDGFYVNASGDSHYRNAEGYYFDFIGRNLGLRSRALEARGGNQGRYELRAGYSEIPRYLGYGTVSPYLGVGTDTLTLPAGWDLDNLESSMMPASLESKRKTLDAGFTIRMFRPWKFEANYERQTRDGTRSFSGGVFAFNGVAFPAPVQFTTNLFNVGLEYAGNRGQARLEFASSDFDNDYNSVSWESPFTRNRGDEVSQSALAPDNKYSQISLAGAFRISSRFRVSGKAYLGKATQNAAFLPYSLNPQFDDLVLPRQSLDGKLETSMYNLSGRMYIRLADRLDLTAQYKKDERDNKTPVDTYTPVLYDVFESDPRTNRPYSYDRQQAWTELRYRPTGNIRFNAGLKRYTLKRTYQAVEKSTEDSYWGEVQFLPWAWLDARLKLEGLSRDATVYEQVGNYDRPEHPLMRKFNMADRDRKRTTIELNLTPIERLGVNLSIYDTDDDYSESVIGLTEGTVSSANLDLNYAFSENTTVYGYVSKESIKSELSGAPRPTSDPWIATTDDDILTWGLGFSGRISEKTTYGFDYVYSNADGRIQTQTLGGDEPPFPVLKSKLKNARVYLQHEFNDQWGLGLDAYREQYDSSDWYVDGYGPLDVNGLMTLGAISPNYDVYVVSVFATLTF